MPARRQLGTTKGTPQLLGALLVVMAGFAACTTPGATAQPTDAMMEHSPAPTDAMMEHSPAPTDAMMEHSPAAS